MRFASRSSTRRTPEDFCSDRNRGKPTWFAGDWESRGDTGGPSMTYPTADVMAGVGCRGLTPEAWCVGPALLCYEFVAVLSGRISQRLDREGDALSLVYVLNKVTGRRLSLMA